MSLLFHPAVIVAALGYCVDVYDLILFSIVRVPSLQSLGLSGAELTDTGLLLLNLQMAGMLIGGIVFGILGDKKGRLSILFGSILIYSIANFANGFVHSVTAYGVLRFLAGIGLAGELGAGVTLVSEILPKEKRGFGTMLIATIGVSGALIAFEVSEHFAWRTAYMIGGGLGFLLLLLRIGVHESGMFKSTEESKVSRGNFLALFSSWSRFKRFALCIFIGIKLWYIIGILVTLSPEFAASLGIQGVVTGGKAIFYAYSGLVVGDCASGLVSQLLKSRRKAMAIFLSGSLVSTLIYFFGMRGATSTQFYALCVALGFFSGYWAVFVTIAAEQFGTNLRATAATSVPNFVRGSLVLLTLLFTSLKPHLGIEHSGLVVGLVCTSLAFLGTWKITESYGRDLDFVEDISSNA